MSLLDLFTSGKHKKAKTYFADLVTIAFADSSLEKHELQYLEKMAYKLDISDSEFTRILEHPEKYMGETPIAYDERIEQLYFFTHMIYADDEVQIDEVKAMRKIAVGLGFPVKNAEVIADEAIHLVMNDNSLPDFTAAIKAVNTPLS